jgi:hypothetical protein
MLEDYIINEQIRYENHYLGVLPMGNAFPPITHLGSKL